MKIDTSTSRQLIVSDYPRGWVGVAMTLIALALGRLVWLGMQPLFDLVEAAGLLAYIATLFGLVAWFARHVVFNFNRQSRILHWSRSALLRSEEGRVPFVKITRVNVEQLRSEQPGGYRVVIHTDRDKLPLTVRYQSGEEQTCREIAEAIQQFLSVPPSPTVDIDEPQLDER